jgi:hypothetical protein
MPKTKGRQRRFPAVSSHTVLSAADVATRELRSKCTDLRQKLTVSPIAVGDVARALQALYASGAFQQNLGSLFCFLPSIDCLQVLAAA